jgi:hypothetical protein
MTKERLNEARREFDKACDEHIARYGRNAKVYLSGAMSHVPRDTWRWRFATVQKILEEQGWLVVNPAHTIIARHPWLYRLVGYRLTLWYDLQLLKRCTHIFMVGPGWRDSRGARLERMKARQWGISELKLR